ncbi:MAG TPA: hypothetical protein VH370_20465 [Humisphaera sp.]|jgi:primase-polymerase (primpol)-like protein|nr:hypothetical protein [Humisphaera sp.]
MVATEKTESTEPIICRDITCFAHVPEDLITLRQWVLWQYEERDGKKTKVLYGINGRRAKSNVPTTWSSYSEVLECYRDGSPASDGIGFVFLDGGGLVGIDIDNCINADGTFKAWAEPIYRKIATDAYCEISPSGNGLKLWTRGTLPGGKGRRKSGLGDDRKGAIEMYQRLRFFTVTGRRFQGVTA